MKNTEVNAAFKANWTPATVGRMAFASDAISSLSGIRYSITDAPRHVPEKPGLYAVYGDDQAWDELGLEPNLDSPLYVGKAEDSLARRELRGHFAAGGGRAQTGSSTVRRSFAALLRNRLGLRGVPRNANNPGHFSNYGLAEGGDAALSTWMHERLTIAVWPAPASLDVPLATVEREVIRHWTPPINIAENPSPAPGLSAARAAMAAEARAWMPGPS
ncbi:GIY-YIG nuclease family protein [Microbacterium sp. NPDC077184]|uniref:GIY-YIG nuclease family protein n=1 Tax=Microbacterium sp. NPDC077184 TaxID=3154764 RepID=UPI00342383AD